MGKIRQTTSGAVVQMITNLPKRCAFVRNGEDMATIYTFDTRPKLSGPLFDECAAAIRDQTRTKYCHPVGEVQHTFELIDRMPPSPLAAVIDGELASRWEEVDEL
jgi:hypothetical protein